MDDWILWLKAILYFLEFFLMAPCACSHFYKWLYWKTKKEFFKKINWYSSPREIEAYCITQDEIKQKRKEKKNENQT